MSETKCDKCYLLNRILEHAEKLLINYGYEDIDIKQLRINYLDKKQFFEKYPDLKNIFDSKNETFGEIDQWKLPEGVKVCFIKCYNKIAEKDLLTTWLFKVSNICSEFNGW